MGCTASYSGVRAKSGRKPRRTFVGGGSGGSYGAAELCSWPQGSTRNLLVTRPLPIMGESNLPVFFRSPLGGSSLGPGVDD